MLEHWDEVSDVVKREALRRAMSPPLRPSPPDCDDRALAVCRALVRWDVGEDDDGTNQRDRLAAIVDAAVDALEKKP